MGDRCAKDHFGNCGETLGDGYCLFHHPDKSGEQSRLFYARLLNGEGASRGRAGRIVFSEAVNWAGYVFPAPPGARDGSGVPLSFAGALFSRAADLRDCTFRAAVDFSGAQFADKANFSSCTFAHRTSFARAQMHADGSFAHCRFASRGDFTQVEFAGEADFDFTEFWGPARFAGSAFSADLSCAAAIFARFADFTGCRFEAGLDFAHTMFRQGIEICPFRRDASRLFHPAAAEEAFRVQENSYRKEGRWAQADAMYVQKMRARRRAQTEGRAFPDSAAAHLYARLETTLVDWTTEYGTSWKRLLITAAIMIIAFAGLYFAGSWLTEAEIYSAHRGESAARGFGAVLYLSAQTFSVLGYGDLYPTGWLKYAAGLQSLLGGFTLALLVVIFARKWGRG